MSTTHAAVGLLLAVPLVFVAPELAVAAAIGRFATPDVVVFTPDLPKTRSGKVLRRHLRQIASGERVSDTEPLRNPEIVGELESIVNGVSE